MKRKTLESGDLIGLTCKALAERFETDHWAAGLQIAHLKDKHLWYIEIHRYVDVEGPVRTVVFKTSHEDLDKALVEAARWAAPCTEAQRDLETYLSDRGLS